jgi:hypothetical protein
MSENVGASTSRNPKGLYGLYRVNFTLPVAVAERKVFDRSEAVIADSNPALGMDV